MQHGLHVSHPIGKLSSLVLKDTRLRTGAGESVPFLPSTTIPDTTFPQMLRNRPDFWGSEHLLEYEDETDEEDRFLSHLDDDEDGHSLVDLLEFDDEHTEKEFRSPCLLSSPLIDDMFSSPAVPWDGTADHLSPSPSSPLMLVPLINSDPLLDVSDCESMVMNIDNSIDGHVTTCGRGHQ